MTVKRRKRTVVTSDSVDREALMLALESQGNAIPQPVVTVIRLAAPIIARLVIRYVARKARKRITEAQVNNASKWIGSVVGGIVERAAKESEEKQ